METRGTTLASAKFFLPGLAFLITTPVLAQLNLVLQGNNLFTGEKRLPKTYQNYSPAASGSRQDVTFSILSFLSPVVNNNDPEEMINDGVKPDIINYSLPSVENKKKANTDNLMISLRPTSFIYPQNPGEDVGIAEYPVEKVLLYAVALKRYAIQNGYDTTYAFLGNMGMVCNKKRFFVVNLETMEIEQSGLVAQGRGLGASRFDRQYSNVKESKCTSLGRYKIFNKYRGEYGESYRLMGLDSTNDNAYSRNVVLHPMGCIPDEEDGSQVCISEGCPAVSVNFLSSLSRIIDAAAKPVLLWLFDSNLEEIVAEKIPEDNVAVELSYEEGAGYHKCSLHSHY